MQKIQALTTPPKTALMAELNLPTGKLWAIYDQTTLYALDFAKGSFTAWQKTKQAAWPDCVFSLSAKPPSYNDLTKKAIKVKGTEFQRKVWQCLLDIPEGSVVTYGDVARVIKHPKAVRAVGGAVGANPICVLIPCHRVIGSNGKLHGFGGGLPLKAKLLAAEGITDIAA